MRDDPRLENSRVSACLGANYGLRAAAITFLPVGYDPNAAVYRVKSDGGTALLLKVRFGPVYEPGLMVPRALIDRGIRNILAPLRTRSSEVWCRLDGYPDYTVVLYPFIEGRDASVVGLSDEQWREFGVTLRAVHNSGLAETFAGQLRAETFALPSAALIRRISDLVATTGIERGSAARFAAFWSGNAERIHYLVARAEELGQRLQSKSFSQVLCHADIHAANILAGHDGRIHLIDWDGPLIGPRERDLIFVIGSCIARRVEPREETLFFDGYGKVEVDAEALAYFRYERIIEDLGEVGKSVLLDPRLSEQAKEEAIDIVESFFAPGGMVERAEVVVRH